MIIYPSWCELKVLKGQNNLSKHFSLTKILSAMCAMLKWKSGLTFAHCVNYMQYGRGSAVFWKVFSTVEAYHQYDRGYSVRMCHNISTVEDVQYSAVLYSSYKRNTDVTCLIFEYIFFSQLLIFGLFICTLLLCS